MDYTLVILQTPVNLIIEIAIFLLLIMVLEITLFLIVKLDYCLGSPTKEEGAETDIKRYSINTLSWLAIVLTLLAIIDKNNPKNISIVIFLIISLILFILSFRFEVIAGVKRIWFLIKQRLFNYAILFLYLAFIIFIANLIPNLIGVVILMGAILIYLHIHELIGDLEIAKGQKKKIKKNG